MRRLVFPSQEEWDRSMAELDELLASATSMEELFSRLMMPGREKSLAITKLQECVLWARLAILAKALEADSK